MILWLNGKLVAEGQAHIDPSDRGFTLGDGLFETIAVRQGKIKRWEAHAARLKEGCSVLDLPFPTFDLEGALDAVLKANQKTEAVLRLTLTRGKSARGVLPPKDPETTLVIQAQAWPSLPLDVKVIVATTTRRNEYSPLARIKSLNYLDNILARQEAALHDADDALLMNTKGFFAESSSANLFIVRKGCVYTPPIRDGALPGTMRALVMQETGACEQSLGQDAINEADEIFLTNSLGVRAIANLNGKPCGQKGERPYLTALLTRLESC